MSVSKGSNGKWRVRKGNCVYLTKEAAEQAEKTIEAKERNIENLKKINNNNPRTVHHG